MPAGYCRKRNVGEISFCGGQMEFLGTPCSLQDVVPRQRAPVLETNTAPNIGVRF